MVTVRSTQVGNCEKNTALHDMHTTRLTRYDAMLVYLMTIIFATLVQVLRMAHRDLLYLALLPKPAVLIPDA